MPRHAAEAPACAAPAAHERKRLDAWRRRRSRSGRNWRAPCAACAGTIGSLPDGCFDSLTHWDRSRSACAIFASKPVCGLRDAAFDAAPSGLELTGRATPDNGYITR